MSGQHVAVTESEDSMLTNRGYRIRSKLGEGTYAKVYLTEYFSTTRKSSKPVLLACKIIDTAKAPRDFVHKFLPREVDILTRVNHPHVIAVHGIFQRRSKHFIMMRYAEQGDVLDFVMENGAVTERQARAWFHQIALAIQYLHELEVAHRDLKCENILITANYNVKVADFGFAREVVDSQGQLLLSDTYCGSLSYAAPEILSGVPYQPKMADMWSCGVILYIMLNKAMPFDSSNVRALAEQQLARRWAWRSKVVDQLSAHVKELVPRLLEPDASKRWGVDQLVTCAWFQAPPPITEMTYVEARALRAARQATSNRFSQEKRATYAPTSSVRVIRAVNTPVSSAKSRHAY